MTGRRRADTTLRLEPTAVAYDAVMKISQLLASLGLAVALVPAAMAQKTDAPRVSATDTYFLSCTVWTGHDWTYWRLRAGKPMNRY